MTLIDLNLSDSYFSCSSSSEGFSSNNSFSSIPSLNESLVSYFSDVLKNFNLVHINAQSIPAHYSDMLSTFENQSVHAILVSESWLKPCLPSVAYALPGFHLIRNDRSGRSGGGVAIYLRSHIPFSILDVSQTLGNAGAEHLFIEVLFCHTKILLGVYYNPSLTIDYFSSFEALLDKYQPLYDHTLLMGDFNTCLVKNDWRARRLQSLVTGANLNILPLAPTHKFPNCSPSLLDLIIVSSTDHVAKYGQCPATEFSYHDLLYISYKLKPPKAKSRTLLRRNFSGIDFERLRQDANNIDWSVVTNAQTVDEQVSLLTSLLIQLFDTHAPVRPVRMKHLPAPWLTPEIKKLQLKKRLSKSKFLANPSDINRIKYLKSRNHCNRVCRDSQRRHIYKSVVEEEDSEKVWNFLKSLGVGKSKQNIIPHNIDLNQLNKHFSVSAAIDSTNKANTLSQLLSSPTPDFPSFKFSQFSISDVKRNIMAIKSNSVGSDCICRKMIIPIIEILAPIITSILNSSISSFNFPSSWKDGQIIPIPKKLNPSSFSEYRPISLLPFLSKVLERLVHQQFSMFLFNHNLLNKFQSGFRFGHSTTTALVKITDDIRKGMDDRMVTVMVLLDFSNAFNTVDYDILLAILISLNVSPEVVDWFRSYLCDRRQRIRIEDSFSDWSTITAGVPQGGVLSPLLFSVFINTICPQISSLYHLYADDLQIYATTSLSNLSRTIGIINEDLSQIFTWCKSYGLTVNPAKSQSIIVGSHRILSKLNMSDLPSLTFGGTPILYAQKVKNLGIIIDQYLSWEPQINQLSRKLYGAVASLRRLRNFLPIPTKIVLANTLLLPILDYADTCYLDISDEYLNRLERLQNLCIRFIFGLRKYDHISDFRKKLKWLPIRLRRNTHILHLLYCVLFNPSIPFYLKERFEFLSNSHNRSLRSNENLVLKIPFHSSSFFANSFSVKAARLWNSLPVNIRQAQSLNRFKSLLKAHYLSL